MQKMYLYFYLKLNVDMNHLLKVLNQLIKMNISLCSRINKKEYTSSFLKQGDWFIVASGQLNMY